MGSRIRVTIGLDEDVYEAVKAKAKRERRTITAQLNFDLERQYGLTDGAAEPTDEVP